MTGRSGFAHPLLLLMALGCAPDRPPERPGAVDLATARAHAAAIDARVRAGGDSVPAAAAIGAAYLQRLRLGLGSPFRLAEYALRDPRLTPRARRETAWALLAATADGRAYEVDPALFGAPGRGAMHLELIRETIEGAGDPRGAEMAVRLAYQLAEAEGTVGHATRRAADGAAALLRERSLARADLDALMQEADTARPGDALERLVRWRRERRFRTGLPPSAGETVAAGDLGMRLVPGVLARLRALQALDDPPPPLPVTTLPAPAAEALLVLLDSLRPPPRAAVGGSVRGLLGLTSRGLEAGERPLLRMFAREVHDEERFVARHARMDPMLRSPIARQALAAITVETALALAASSQERVWHHGFGGPGEVDLQWRFGLDSVSVSPRVPAEWRPYLLFALEGALADWVEIFPASTLRGVRIRFGDEGVPDVALAVHAPTTRTIRLPPSTGFGNLAHELGHEMDRAESERRYGSSRRYATDDAVRRDLADPFASASRGLLMRSPDGLPPPDSPEGVDLHRPAEIFARSVEWYAAAVLADRGRVNGDLVAVRDERLSGFGTMDRVAPFDSAAPSLARTLLLMTPVPPRDLRVFQARYSRALSPRPAVLADSLLEAGAPAWSGTPRDSAGRERWLASARARLERVREIADSARREYVACAPGSLPGAAPSPEARLALIGAAEGAAVLRILRHYAAALAGVPGPAWLAARERRFSADGPRVGPLAATWLGRLEDSARRNPADPLASLRWSMAGGRTELGCGPAS